MIKQYIEEYYYGTVILTVDLYWRQGIIKEYSKYIKDFKYLFYHLETFKEY